MPLSTITDDPLGLSCLYLALPRPPLSTLFPYTTLFRSHSDAAGTTVREPHRLRGEHCQPGSPHPQRSGVVPSYVGLGGGAERRGPTYEGTTRSEEHTSELQSLRHLVCRLLLEKKKTIANRI